MTDRMPPAGITFRELDASEIERADEIDRSEVIDGVFRVRDGALVHEDHYFEARGWPAGALEAGQREMRACLERGGAAWGAFADGRLVGIATLDGQFIGVAGDTLDLYFLHVSNGFRAQGIGGELVRLVRERARRLGATRLYVSATQSQNTVKFYRRLGFDLAEEVDPRLFEREPEDIHMDMKL